MVGKTIYYNPYNTSPSPPPSPLTSPTTASSPQKQPTSTKTFQAFGRLPTELQILIFKYALQHPRLLNLYYQPGSPWPPRTPYPSLLSINHLSRTLALNHYAKFGASHLPEISITETPGSRTWAAQIDSGYVFWVGREDVLVFHPPQVEYVFPESKRKELKISAWEERHVWNPFFTSSLPSPRTRTTPTLSPTVRKVASRRSVMEEYVRVCKFGRGFWTSMRSSPENVEVCSCYPSYALNYLRKRIFVNLDEIYVLPSPDADAEGGDKMGWSGGVGVDDLECVARFEDLEEGEMRCGKCLPTWLERKRAVVEEGRKRGDAEFVGR